MKIMRSIPPLRYALSSGVIVGFLLGYAGGSLFGFGLPIGLATGIGLFSVVYPLCVIVAYMDDSARARLVGFWKKAADEVAQKLGSDGPATDDWSKIQEQVNRLGYESGAPHGIGDFNPYLPDGSGSVCIQRHINDHLLSILIRPQRIRVGKQPWRATFMIQKR